jgi:tetraacyldisaccharide 4'-kinase
MAKTLKAKIEDAMWGGDITKAQHVALRALSLLYGLLVRARLFLFKSGLLRSRALTCPVISVGNITVGGSGKTPIVAALCEVLTAKGKSVVILSRGYKRQSSGTEVVSDKNSVLLDVKKAGDEPFLLAHKCKGVPVIVGKNRFKAGLLAIKKFSPDVIILDDAFQHIKLRRDLDILLFDSTRAVGSGFMLPRGPLREPASSIKRADIIMIKGKAKGVLQNKYHFKQQVFTFDYSPTKLISLSDKKTEAIKGLRGKKVFAFSALANPESFYLTAQSCGATIIDKLSFPDHHWFSPADIENIKKHAKGTDFIVTTEKDLVRLDPDSFTGLRVVAIAIEAKISNQKGFFKVIEKTMEPSQTG